MSKNDKKNFAMSPYHDIHSPFSVGGAGNFAEYIARDRDRFPELILGTFALIQDQGAEKKPLWMVAQIIELKAMAPFNPQKETALYAPDEEFDPAAPLSEVEGPHDHQPMIARVRLERQMESENEKGGRPFISLPVQRPPSGRSRLHFPAILEKTDDRAPSLREMLDIPRDGVALGYVGQGNEPFQKNGALLDYKWNVDKLDNKHIFIVGESGSGKTVLLKRLAYALRTHKYKSADKPRILMTDVQGDISQLLAHEMEGASPPPNLGWQGKKTHDMKKAMSQFGKFRLIVPAMKRDPSSRLSALKILAEKHGHEVREIGLRMQDLSEPSDVEYLFRVSSEQAAPLLNKQAEIYCHGQNLPATLANLHASVSKGLQAANDKGGRALVGETPFLSTTFEAALRALSNLEEYFDFHEESMRGERNPLNALDFDGTVILYMDDLDHDERIMWEMQLVKWLYDNRQADWNAFVFFDEAHQIIPAKPRITGVRGAAGTFDRLRLNFERLAREGRKFGINLVLGTQSPRDLHSIVPEQCATKIVMKINPRNAAAASLEDKELAGIAARFGAGQFFIQSPFNGTPDWVRVHSGAPPLPHMSMTDYWHKAEKAAANEN